MMRRQLTSYESSGDPVEDERIAAIMKAEGCTAPVAKNMLKFAKLGIGPVPGGAQEKKPIDLPFSKTKDRKAELMAAERRQREMEEQDDEPDLGAFLGGGKKKPARPVASKQEGGLARLGPVLARQEEVDPLLEPSTFEDRRRKADADMYEEADRQKRAQQRRDDEARLERSRYQDEGSDVDYDSLPTRFPTEKEKKKSAQQQQQPEEGRRRRKKRKDRRKRGRDWEDENGDEDEPPQDRRSAKEKSMSRSRSPSPEAPQPSKGSLMSEAEILKVMRHGKKKSRHSDHAHDRIQKELNEWEARKQENSEFWKAPKFCLCYSAETTKTIRKV
eukprot:gnl/MRDRNA2_/MRDRNA2_94414_c0_seq1.p1 gnl/MRDRNA2_/MRDRNA2_94414_c0~~gnl/MRDRNA2_/MRDRNA2_94414_c0_seq1.p1  ORF type:complete len:331 (+),score=97.32 gnl/MRDRNA2_/MRDRNA2_94414_c0_seq1:158-1150(+)